MMREQAKITSKGQITVPKRVRETLGVKPGDSIVFEEINGKMEVLPVSRVNPFDKYRGIERRGKGLTRAEVIAQVRRLRDPEAD